MGHWKAFQATGTTSGFNLALQGYQDAVDATPANHPGRERDGVRLQKYGDMYLDKLYWQTQAIEDLDTSVKKF